MSVKTKEEAQAYCDYLIQTGYVSSCVPVKTEDEWMIDVRLHASVSQVSVNVEVDEDGEE